MHVAASAPVAVTADGEEGKFTRLLRPHIRREHGLAHGYTDAASIVKHDFHDQLPVVLMPAYGILTEGPSALGCIDVLRWLGAGRLDEPHRCSPPSHGQRQLPKAPGHAWQGHRRTLVTHELLNLKLQYGRGLHPTAPPVSVGVNECKVDVLLRPPRYRFQLGDADGDLVSFPPLPASHANR